MNQFRFSRVMPIWMAHILLGLRLKTLKEKATVFLSKKPGYNKSGLNSNINNSVIKD